MHWKREKQPLLAPYHDKVFMVAFCNFVYSVYAIIICLIPNVILFEDGDYTAVPTSQPNAEAKSSNGDNLKENAIELSTSLSTVPVTYSWENISVYLETKPGNVFSRLCKNSPPIQKRILDNGQFS